MKRLALALTIAAGAAMTGLGTLLGVVATRSSTARTYVWQIDPSKCVLCGNCATACVLKQSAVKCVHSFAICGYCNLCTGYFEPEPNALTTAAENQLCPTNRHLVENARYFRFPVHRSRTGTDKSREKNRCCGAEIPARRKTQDPSEGSARAHGAGPAALRGLRRGGCRRWACVGRVERA